MSIPDPERTLRRLRSALDAFIADLERLPMERFLARTTGWSPRDIAAHLVGWHRLTIEGAEVLRRGRTPFYFADAGNDYAAVNASLVERYDTNDRGLLVEELRRSFAELESYVRGLPPGAWAADTGARYRGDPTTIANSVAVLIEELESHRRDLERALAAG